MKMFKQYIVISLLVFLPMTMVGEEYSLPIFSYTDSTITVCLQQWIESCYDTIGTKNLALTICCYGYRYGTEKLYFTCAMRQRDNLPYITHKGDSVGDGIVLLENGNIAYLAEVALWKDIVKPCGRDTIISLSSQPTSPLSLSYFTIDYLPAKARINNVTEISDIDGNSFLSRDTLGKWHYMINATHSEEVALYGPKRDSLCMYLDSYIDSLQNAGIIRLYQPRRPWSVDADVLCLFFDSGKRLADVRVINCDSNRDDDCEGSRQIRETIYHSQEFNSIIMEQYPCAYIYAFHESFDF